MRGKATKVEKRNGPGLSTDGTVNVPIEGYSMGEVAIHGTGRHIYSRFVGTLGHLLGMAQAHVGGRNNARDLSTAQLHSTLASDRQEQGGGRNTNPHPQKHTHTVPRD